MTYQRSALVHHFGRPGGDGIWFPGGDGGERWPRPEREVVDIDGDGSFLMNVQELACAKVEGIAAKAIILNNQHLGMVVQWEDRFYKSNRGHTFLGNPATSRRRSTRITCRFAPVSA